MAAVGPGELSGEDVPLASRIARFAVDVDSTPMLKGLPGDRCTCPHWGFVCKGKVTYTFDDREEVHEAGGAFYLPGGIRSGPRREPSTSSSARPRSCARSRRRS
jgi:hypothetical protein